MTELMYQTEHWDKKTTSYHYEIYGRQSILHFKFQKWVESLKIKSMLEVGCGVGIYANLYSDKDYYGTDLYTEGISYLKRIRDPDHFYHGRFNHVKIDKKFDLVFALQTIEHMENPDEAIRKMIGLSNKYFYIGLHTGLENTHKHRVVDHGDYIQTFLSKKVLTKLLKELNVTYSLEPFDYEGKLTGMIIKGAKND